MRLAACTGAAALLQLDGTLITVALPSVAHGLKVSSASTAAILSAYFGAYAIVLLPAGALVDRFGARRLALCGLAVFAVGAGAGAVVSSMGALIATRVVQGAGAGLVSPAALAGAVSGFPPERRGSALGIWGASAGISNLLGPLLGGLLTVALGWRANWWALVPLALIAAAGIVRYVPAVVARRGRRDRGVHDQPRRARRHARRGAHVRGDDRLLLPGLAVPPARGRLLGARRLERARDRRPAGGSGGSDRRPPRRRVRGAAPGDPRLRARRRRSGGARDPGHAALEPGHDPAADPGRIRARDAVRPDLARGAERDAAGLARAHLGGPVGGPAGRRRHRRGAGRRRPRRAGSKRPRCTTRCCSRASSASPWEFPRRLASGRPAAASRGARRSRSDAPRFRYSEFRPAVFGASLWGSHLVRGERKTERPEPAAQQPARYGWAGSGSAGRDRDAVRAPSRAAQRPEDRRQRGLQQRRRARLPWRERGDRRPRRRPARGDRGDGPRLGRRVSAAGSRRGPPAGRLTADQRARRPGGVPDRPRERHRSPDGLRPAP